MRTFHSHDLGINNFHQWSNFIKYLVIILFAIILCVFNYYIFIKSNNYQYKLLVIEEKKMRKEFEKKQLFSNLEDYQKQLKIIRNIDQDNLKYLVKNTEIAGLLHELAKAGELSGVLFELFSPNITDKKNTKGGIIIKIEALGEYRLLSTYLRKIASLGRLVTFEQIEIIKKDTRNSKNKFEHKIENLLRMKMDLKINQY